MVKEEIIKNLPLEKKIALCSGASFWQTEKMEEYGIDSIFMADGPHGLRKQINTNDMLGINRSVAATCFPAEVLTACSFDESLLRRIGQAIAIEAKANEVNVVLGPGANIKRNPLCGRNFEYFSEDPLLSGKMAAAFIQGVENEGVGSSLKHFALNSQEYRRFVSDSVVDERTMHEIYLKSFEIAVKEGKPSTVMSSYNKVNGISSSSNPYLLTDILRKQWGFDGLVVTDWGAMKDRIASFKAGCDLCMPGGSAYMEKEAMDAVKQGTLNEKQIDQSVERVLNLIEKTKLSTKTTADLEAHHQLACEVVKESAVLLKNEDKILPLDNLNDVAIIGQFASAPRYQGSGSSHINPYKMTSVMDTVPSAQYAQGYNEDGTTKDSLIEEAKEIARNKKAVLIFAGLTDRVESEGFERDDMKMSDGHNRLIEEVAKINKNTVVILFSGSAVELPWEKDVKAILYAGLPGQASGQALVDLLTGKANPSGKLAETWPMRYEDCISSTYYGTQQDAHYREGLYVGYRYYHSANISVKYPFGHGLSYASFEYS
ncbi:MAG: glycoside hydrolase family 3 protein, partial [Erysipelotrichaceae bacterium]|nr:glycoside hydrolase family 3 protein [Erysipelotrichaceae bacterium]